MTEERQEFEKSAKGVGLECARQADGEYVSAFTDTAWQSWQASRRSTLDSLQKQFEELAETDSYNKGYQWAADYVKGLARP